MKCVFTVPEDFLPEHHRPEIEESTKALQSVFPNFRIELFFYIKPDDRWKFFILRINSVAPDEFLRAAQDFGSRLNIRMLSGAEANSFSHNIGDLDTYV